jgi:hypothetical protein
VRRHSALVLGALAGAAAVAAVLRRRRRAPERADVFFADGSMVSLDGHTEEGERLLAAARDALLTV